MVFNDWFIECIFPHRTSWTLSSFDKFLYWWYVRLSCRGVRNYLDDILIYGITKSDHNAILENVSAGLREHIVKLNDFKCIFGSQRGKFLGFRLTPRGWEIEDEKIAAINRFRVPTPCSEVKNFLGLVTFIDKFIMNRADKTSDKFDWKEEEENEFSLLKRSFTEQQMIGIL